MLVQPMLHCVQLNVYLKTIKGKNEPHPVPVHCQAVVVVKTPPLLFNIHCNFLQWKVVRVGVGRRISLSRLIRQAGRQSVLSYLLTKRSLC